VITWSLFTMWVLFNLVDVVISGVAIRLGACEIGVLYQVSGSWLSLAINKMALALLIGGVLVYARKDSWLRLLSLGMAGLCIYNGWALWQQITG
jgi:hypothetical protein